MINRTEAERLALAVHDVRPEWPIKQLMTLIEELRVWPLRDLAVGLMWVALDQTPSGGWVSKTPYRVREQGPWRTVGIGNAEAEEARAAEAARLKQRIAEQELAGAIARSCDECDARGYLPSGQRCAHDAAVRARTAAGVAMAREALSKAGRS